MDWLQALILGIIQGLTEYLPVSSSGHLAIGATLFGIDDGNNLSFTIAVHVATVLSTCCILWKDIIWIFRDLFKFKWNDGTRYAVNIIISMIPIGIVGVFFKDFIDNFFETSRIKETFGNPLLIVGCCLCITALLLTFSYNASRKQEANSKVKENISPLHAFIIGIAQAVAALPGLSRSGSTIATGLLLGNDKKKLAQFSFLMVIPPILGEALLDFKKLFVATDTATSTIGTVPLIVGFLAAFIVGCLACKWMINIVKKGKLVWFALYCAVVGMLCVVLPYIF